MDGEERSNRHQRIGWSTWCPVCLRSLHRQSLLSNPSRYQHCSEKMRDSQWQSSNRLETARKKWVCSAPSGQMGFTQGPDRIWLMWLQGWYQSPVKNQGCRGRSLMSGKKLTWFPALGRSRKRTQGKIIWSASPQPLENPLENILSGSISEDRKDRKASRNRQQGFLKGRSGLTQLVFFHEGRVRRESGGGEILHSDFWHHLPQWSSFQTKKIQVGQTDCGSWTGRGRSGSTVQPPCLQFPYGPVGKAVSINTREKPLCFMPCFKSAALLKGEGSHSSQKKPALCLEFHALKSSWQMQIL